MPTQAKPTDSALRYSRQKRMSAPKVAMYKYTVQTII